MSNEDTDWFFDNEHIGFTNAAQGDMCMPQTGTLEIPSLAIRPSINDPGLNPLISARSGTFPWGQRMTLTPELYGSQGDDFQQTYGQSSSHMALEYDQQQDSPVTADRHFGPPNTSDPNQHHDHAFVKLVGPTGRSNRQFFEYQLSCSRCETKFGAKELWLEDCKEPNRKCKLAVL